MEEEEEEVIEREIFEYATKKDPKFKPVKTRRMRTRVGRSVRGNDVTIILSIASLVPLIDERLASLRKELPNHPATKASRDEAIANYERVKRDLEALQKVAFTIKSRDLEEQAVEKATNTFRQGVRDWWAKRHDDICSKASDATLFVSCVGLCSLAGCGGTVAVAVSGALVGGKPVIEALSEVTTGYRPNPLAG
jgi:hypothetical protein